MEKTVQERNVAEERVLVIIPTYNERENLPRIVPRVLGIHPGLQVLVVDDESPDGTGQWAAAMAREEPRVHVLHLEGKGGLGRAYIEGFRWGLAREFDLFLEMDADLSHPPEKIPAMLEASRTHPVVLGSRYVGRRVNVVNWPLTRLLVSVFGSIYARVITRLPVMDATGGFNLWRREVLEAIPLDRVESNGYAFQVELKLRAWRKGYDPLEIPIVFTERETGESKMSKRIALEAVWKLWKLRVMDLFGRL
jgi:dolichol-phosphate mannosyltransferase